MAQTNTRKRQPAKKAASASRAAPKKKASPSAKTQKSRYAAKPKKAPASRKTAAQAEKERKAARRRRNQRGAVVLFALSIFLFFLSVMPGVHAWNAMYGALHGLFGMWAVLWAVLLCYVSIVTAFVEREDAHLGAKVLLSALSIIALCGVTFAVTCTPETVSLAGMRESLSALYLSSRAGGGAGLFGGLLGVPCVALFGRAGACIVLLLLLFVLLMLLTGTTLVRLWRGVQRPAKAVGRAVSARREQRVQPAPQAAETDPLSHSAIDIPLEETPAPAPRRRSNEKLRRLEKALDIEVPPRDTAVPPPSAVVEKKAAPPPAPPVQEAPPAVAESAPAAAPVSEPEPAAASLWKEPEDTDAPRRPPLEMLSPDPEEDLSRQAEEQQQNSQKLEEVLSSFGVKATVVHASRGPAVTRYELKPASGVKISKITNLADDIALNLEASGVRIEAPIPGKAAVGIEVPNRQRSIVRMRGLVESRAFTSAKSPLTVCLGRDIAGAPKVADLAKMPHLLIAGTTGSGKSVCLNSFIISLLYKAKPDEVKFLMIDPKVVELSVYNGIPQLLVPVVTDPRKAAGALGWAVTEMGKRYKIFAEFNVRDIKGYTEYAEQHDYTTADGQPMEPMPKIVIFIEELADLMMAAPSEVEDSICRLAQMARAAGMHLVIATQRPSVDVVTGLIKANIPSRIALSVSSQVDSRTILDTAGAEKLLGNGDMLYSPVGIQKPLRIQGAFVSDAEIESIVSYIKRGQEPGYDEGIAEEIEKRAVEEKKESSAEESDLDPMLDEAIKCVVEAGQASTSLLQRRLRLGYARAGRIVDQMEQLGIVGPHEGSKPRQVLLTYQQWLERSMNAHAPAPKEGEENKAG